MLGRLAPLRLLLDEFQSVVDEAEELRGEHHLALCGLTQRMHETLRNVDLPVNATDLQLAKQQAITEAICAQHEDEIRWLETTNDNLRKQNATYFHQYSYLNAQKILFKKLVPQAKSKEIADEARKSCQSNDTFFETTQREENVRRRERNRVRAEANARALAVICERFE